MLRRAFRDPSIWTGFTGVARYLSLPAGMALLAVAILVGVPSSAEARYASFVMDADTGRIYHSVNANTRNYPASLTKMMTLYMVFDALKAKKLTLGQKLTASARAAGQPPSRIGLNKGDRITVENAVLALVTKSANDVATVLAEALAPTESAFARDMTEQAHRLGMTRTSFRNASGLPNRHQLSTARDMATLVRALLRDHPAYYRYFSTTDFVYQGHRYRNHNNLLGDYDGTDGVKTGYIRASGFNLAASARRQGVRLIGVVFGGRSAASRDLHMTKLLDKAFEASNRVLVAETSARDALVLPRRKPDSGVEPDTTGSRLVAAAQPPLPVPRPELASTPTESGSAAGGTWAVQVGAYRHPAHAQGAITKVQATIPEIVGGAKGIIVPREGSRGALFRARLIGLSKDAANDACRALARRDHPCMTLRYSVEDENLALRLSLSDDQPSEIVGSLETAPPAR